MVINMGLSRHPHVKNGGLPPKSGTGGVRYCWLIICYILRTGQLPSGYLT